MTRKRTVVIAVAFSLISAVAVVGSWQTIRLARLSWRLNNAGSSESAALVAAELLRSGSDAAIATVVRYAESSDLRAFDARRKILLIHDAPSRSTYTVYVGQSGSVAGPLPEEFMRELVPTPALTSFSIGDPPTSIARVELVQSVGKRTDFVLGPDEMGEYFQYRFRFDGDRLVAQGLHERPKSKKSDNNGVARERATTLVPGPSSDAPAA